MKIIPIELKEDITISPPADVADGSEVEYHVTSNGEHTAEWSEAFRGAAPVDEEGLTIARFRKIGARLYRLLWSGGMQ